MRSGLYYVTHIVTDISDWGWVANGAWNRSLKLKLILKDQVICVVPFYCARNIKKDLCGWAPVHTFITGRVSKGLYSLSSLFWLSWDNNRSGVIITPICKTVTLIQQWWTWKLKYGIAVQLSSVSLTTNVKPELIALSCSNSSITELIFRFRSLTIKG